MRPMTLVFPVCLGLAACAAPPPPGDTVELAPGITLVLPAAAELGRSVEAVQMVTARYAEESWTFEARLSVNAKGLRLACLDAMGRRALSVTWADGRLAAERLPWVPDELRAENMLADIVLLYWPEEVVRRALKGAELSQDGTGRRIGDAVAIAWAGDPWNGAARLRNAAWNYELDISSATVAP
ncbi:DUF3261 domain-containing protein [Magnetospirillum sp. UT-4]|uniref:DUF3261 domain-containing protein n=1 Tax=Magnetospirillum sp. UT-4 TaxID=2681467 RepID=UPI001380EBCB|nr:DUF3261 domain-containing protein [Magnetospirillum sp. UT-4]CAA7626547.1 conserved exported hypothetical protein [Magnetospirillum sp. UT-4]